MRGHAVRLRLKHIKVARYRCADGSVTVYRYHRLTGRRIEGEPGTPEFLASYAAAGGVTDRDAAGTLAAAIAAYRRGDWYRALADRTRADYERHLPAIRERFGSSPLAVWDDPRIRTDVKAWRDGIVATSGARQGQYAVQVLSAVLSWAAEEGMIRANLVRGMRHVYSSDRSAVTWQPDDVAAFLAAAPAEIALALRLALDLGQRQGDLIRLTWDQFDGRVIRLRQRKTGADIAVPVSAELRSALAVAPRSAVTILINGDGRPWLSANGFRARWREIATRARLRPGLHFHDLRGTAVTRLAEAGCTVPEIAAITGLSLAGIDGILERYLARTSSMAASGIAKLDDWRTKGAQD